nr:MAG TPA: hypothetical protein [Caudoviricetes sp.]
MSRVYNNTMIIGRRRETDGALILYVRGRVHGTSGR